MADILPPIPYDLPQTSFEWVDWYEKLRKTINQGDIPHNDLPGLQGGTNNEYYHLTAAEHANITSGYALLAGGNDFTGAQAVAFSTLTDATNISVNGDTSNHFRVTLAGNRTLDNPTNMSDGAIYNFWVKQDATGSRTLAYGSKYKWPAGTAPTLTTTANALDVIACQYNSTLDILACSIIQDIR